MIDGVLVYVPAETMISRSLEHVQDWLRERGLTTEDILSDIEAHKDEIFAELYPDLSPSMLPR